MDSLPLWLLALPPLALLACRGSVDRVYDDDLIARGTVDGGDVGDAGTDDVDLGDGNGTGPAFTVGGTVNSLNGTLSITNNGRENLDLNQDGPWQFPTPVPSGASYGVAIVTQPVGQTCTVSNGNGTVGAGPVTNVTIDCVPTHSVGGTITGLEGTGLVLENEGGDDLQVAPKASTFTFATPLAQGAPYAVTVATQPTNPSQTCVVSNGVGTVGGTDVSSVAVKCTTNAYHVSANVSGLNGAIVLQNNGTDDTNANAPGVYPFPTAILSGKPYAVTVSQPANGRCVTVAPSSGTIGSSPVTVNVTCASAFLENFDGSVVVPAGWNVTIPVGMAGVDDWTVYYFTATPTNHFIGQAPSASRVDTSVITPPIPIVTKSAQLRFDHYYDTQTNHDGGVLEIKIGGGPFQDILAAGGSFVSGGYNASITSSTNPIGLRQAWTGLLSGSVVFAPVVVNLPPAAAGNSIELAFRWGSDTGTASSWGWAIDNVRVDP